MLSLSTTPRLRRATGRRPARLKGPPLPTNLPMLRWPSRPHPARRDPTRKLRPQAAGQRRTLPTSPPRHQYHSLLLLAQDSQLKLGVSLVQLVADDLRHTRDRHRATTTPTTTPSCASVARRTPDEEMPASAGLATRLGSLPTSLRTGRHPARVQPDGLQQGTSRHWKATARRMTTCLSPLATTQHLRTSDA